MSSSTVKRNYPKGATPAHKVSKIAWIPCAPMWALALIAAVGSAGCAAEASEQAAQVQVVTDTSSPTIFAGTKDDDSESLGGVVALRVGKGATFELCTGALIASTVVLTARHCVTKNVTTSVSCDENGQSANGEHVSEDEDPATIGVYLGASPSFAKAPVSTVRAIVAPTGPYLCDSDIALIVLATPITDIAPLAVRLSATSAKGETIRSVGYGQNDKSAPIGTRFRKAGVPVLAQGKAISPSKTPLGAHEFEVGRSICQGDSGGPAISEQTGAVIGVVSRGGGCDDDFGHIYTTTSGFDDMFSKAFELARGKPTVEVGEPSTTAASTRTRTTANNSAADEEASAGAAGCSITPRNGAGGVGTSGLVAIAAVIAALGRRASRQVRRSR